MQTPDIWWPLFKIRIIRRRKGGYRSKIPEVLALTGISYSVSQLLPGRYATYIFQL